MQPSKCILLAEKIKVILQGGFTLSNPVSHFIDSTFYYPTIKNFKKIIGATSNCERDTLVDLIFFPDESIQIRLEELLGKEHYRKEDEEKVCELLLSQELKTVISFPDARGSLELVMPNSAVPRFISRLNISKKTDPRLIRAIDRHRHRNPGKIASGCLESAGGKNQIPDSIRAKVRLRNASSINTENRILFMCTFLEKIEAQNSDFFECLDFVIGFLDELQEENDFFQAFSDKKRSCLQNIQKAEKHEEQLKKNSMETYALQGLRLPYINKDDLQKKVVLIDRISRAVFGKTAA